VRCFLFGAVGMVAKQKNIMQMDSRRQPSSAIGSNPSFAQAADQRRSTRDQRLNSEGNSAHIL
jgi:hypothetical protein